MNYLWISQLAELFEKKTTYYRTKYYGSLTHVINSEGNQIYETGIKHRSVYLSHRKTNDKTGQMIKQFALWYCQPYTVNLMVNNSFVSVAMCNALTIYL